MAEPVIPPDTVEPLSAACLRHGCERARFDRRVVLHTLECDLAHITVVAAIARRLVAIPIAEQEPYRPALTGGKDLSDIQESP